MRRREFVVGSIASLFFVACSGGEESTNPDGTPTTPGGATDPALAGDLAKEPVTPGSAPEDSDRVFPQGLASGDPRPDRVILWSRIEAKDAGVSPTEDHELEFIVAKDEALTQIVARGKVPALADADHTVRVVPTGLEPGRVYHYRFQLGAVTTRVGRTRTAPAPDSDIPVRFAFCSCQDYIGRYWHSWKALLDEKAGLDFVLFLGDYIYETVNDARFQSTTPDRSITLPDGMDTSAAQDKSRTAARTLADYRALYKVYRSDPLLREVHRLYPFIITWDDHEFADDCWQDHSTSFNEKDPLTGGFTDEGNSSRRKAASRAFSEYQPADIRSDKEASFPNDIQIYRTIRWGKHVELFMTDQRMYRDDHLIPEGPTDFAIGKLTSNSAIGSRYFIRKSVFDPREKQKKPSLLGATQKAWFLDKVKSSNATWKVWGNEVQVYQMALRLAELPGVPSLFTYTVYVNGDQWDGFRSEREEVLSEIERAGVRNLLVCTGDIHGFFASELHVDFDRPTVRPCGVEYVTAGISSASLKNFVEKVVPMDSSLRPIADAWANGADAALQTTNPHLRYAKSHAHGFSIVSVDKDKAEVTFVQLGDPREKTSQGVLGRESFVTRSGSNTIERTRG